MEDYNAIRDLIKLNSGWKSAMLGGGVGLGDALNPRSYYSPTISYRGNGLASIYGGQQSNPDYRDWTSGGLSANRLLQGSKDSNGDSLFNLGQLNRRKERYGSVEDAIDKEVRPTTYDLYSDNYGYRDNNYGTGMSRGITDYINGVPSNYGIQGVLYNQREDVPSSIYSGYIR